MSTQSLIYTIIANIAVFLLACQILEKVFTEARWTTGNTILSATCITFLFWFFT